MTKSKDMLIQPPTGALGLVGRYHVVAHVPGSPDGRVVNRELMTKVVEATQQADVLNSREDLKQLTKARRTRGGHGKRGTEAKKNTTRNKQIRESTKASKQLADEFGLSVSTVNRIRGKSPS